MKNKLNYVRKELDMTVVVVPIFNWRVTYIQLANKKDRKEVKKIFTDLEVPFNEQQEVLTAIKRGAYNGGIMMSNLEDRKSIIVIYPCYNKKEYISIVSHEISHVVDDIMEHCGIRDGETGAYLTGFISSNILTKYL